MNIKIFRIFLKIWIVLGSLAAFLGGWVMLGHSGKPVSSVQAADPNANSTSQLAPLPTLAPLPSLSSGSNSLPYDRGAGNRAKVEARARAG